MKCKFQSIQGQGFMTFKEPFVFPIAVFGNQTVFIQGENRDEPMAESNGSGKSNLLEAFTFALFGKVSKKMRYLDDIINLESDEAEVKVGLSLDGEYYQITRKRFRNRTVANEIHIFKGEDEQLQDSDNTEKQKYIERLIGLSFLSYSHCIMFCQRFVAFPELKAPQRAAVLSEIAGGHKYLKAAEIAKERATGLSTAISETEQKMKNITDVIVSLSLNDFDKSSKEWEDKKQADIQNLVDQWNKLEDKLRETRSKHTRAVKAQKLIIFKLEEKYNDASTWLEPFQDVVDKKNKQAVEFIKTDTQIKNLKSQMREKQKELERMKETQSGNCPYCGQEITQETLSAHVKELARTLGYMEREYITLTSIYEDEEKEVDALNEQITKFNNLKKELRELYLDISLKKKDLEALESRKDEAAIEEQIELIKKQHETLRVATDPYSGMKEKQEVRLAEEDAKLKEIAKELKRLKDEQQYFTVWAENFPKLRMMLLEEIVSRLEHEAQRWLAKYSSELSVEIDTERETQSGNIRDEVNITIITPKGKVPYEGYGGGEIQKIRMSISLALSDIIAEKAEREFNVIMFDEPNVGLDRVGKESNIEVFNDLAETRTVLIIEHDEYFQDRMNETVTVVKENHQSFIQGV